jgi:hypothetical protein
VIARPLLFLDVDGTLLPYGSTPHHQSAPEGNPLLGKLDPGIGARLLALGCDLVWATTWQAVANEEIAPRIGLPPLPVVEFPDADADDPPGVHWKAPTLVEYAAGRPFSWLDDEIGVADGRWIGAHHPGAALAHRVDPMFGVTDTDLQVVRVWIDSE